MSIEFEVGSDSITPSVRRIQRQLNRLPAGAHQVFVDNTPVRTGNARRRTRLTGDTIRADYPYAQPLDRGRSRQSPQGMTRPTERWLRNELKKIMRK
jgi:hypothetical protein